MTNKPATPLPWRVDPKTPNPSYGFIRADGSLGQIATVHAHWKTNATYIVAACNAYPRLVDALQSIIKDSRKAENLAWECGTETEDGFATILEDSRGDAWRELSDARSNASELLCELGEL